MLLLSPLSREVGGRRYYGISKEKAAARAEYEDRKVNSENVGLVESRSVLVCGGVMWGGVWWSDVWRCVVVCGGVMCGGVCSGV